MKQEHFLDEQEASFEPPMYQLQFFDSIRNHGHRQRRQSIDTLSISSLKGPNTTTIKVPYKRLMDIERQAESRPNLEPISNLTPTANPQTSNEMSLERDIENLRKRLASIQQVEQQLASNPKQRETIPRDQCLRDQIIEAYNVRVIKQKSPFLFDCNHNKPQQDSQQHPQHTDSGADTLSAASGDTNNIHAGIDLDSASQLHKYRAIPVLVEPSLLLSVPHVNGSKAGPDEQDDEEDRMSQISSCSLQSSKTYNVRKATEEWDERRGPTLERQETTRNGQTEGEGGEDFLNRKNPAWIFDPRDHSSTFIAPPPKPKRPPTPEVQTEELAQTTGGRSYFLEVLVKDEEKQKEKEKDEVSYAKKVPTIHSFWRSQGALNLQDASSGSIDWPPAPSNKPEPIVDGKQTNKSSGLGKLTTLPVKDKVGQSNNASETKIVNYNRQQKQPRRQLPYGGAPPSMMNRSKSSSCLLNVTKPSKYSIYGGFRKPGETNKPVPRLSYSRAIGPRSQRQSTEVLPSRYLKVK